MTTEAKSHAHLGRNIRHFREENDLSQEAFADLLGNAWTQKKISQLEAKPHVDAATLEEVAKALELSVEQIKDYVDPSTVSNVQNNYEGSNTQQGPNINFQCTINPIDKYAEANDRLVEAYAKIEKLNEALLKEKDEKIALLERMLKEKG